MSPKTKLAVAIPIIALFVLPSFVTVASASATNNVWELSILQGPLVTCTGTGGSNGLPACSNLCDLIATFVHIVYFGIAVVIWIVTPIMFAWGGIRFMLSRGNPGAMSGAKKQLTATVIGLLIVLAAYLIVFTFVTVLGIAGVGGFGASSCAVQ